MLNKIATLLKSKLFRAAGIYTISSGLAGGIPFLLLPVLTRYLSPEDYGVMSMFGLLISILGVFVGLAVHGAIFNQYFKYDKDELSAYIGNCILILLSSSAILSIFVYLGRNLIFQYTQFPTDWLWAVLLVSAASFLVSIRLVTWQAEKKALSYGTLQVSIAIANVVFSICFVVLYKLNWHGRVLSQVVVSSSAGLFSLISLWRAELIQFKFKSHHIHNALSFGVPLIPHTLGAVIITMTDRFLLTNMSGLTDTGIYTVAMQIGMVFSFFTDAFNKAFCPWLFEQLKTADETFNIRIVRMSYLYFGVVLGIGLIPFLIPISAISFFLGEKFQLAHQYLKPIFLGFAFNGMYYMVCNYIFYEQKTKYLSLVTFLSGTINIGLSYYFIKTHGAMGAAIGTSIAFGLTFIFTWYFSNKVHPLPWGEVFFALFKRKNREGQ